MDYEIGARVTIISLGYHPETIQGTITEISKDFQGQLYAVKWDGKNIVEHYRTNHIELECSEGGPHIWDAATGICEKCFESKKEEVIE